MHIALCPNGNPANWLKQAPLPRQLESRDSACLRRVAKDPVAVRSSAVGEDQEGATCPGSTDWSLDVVGSDDVLEKLRLCWASLWTERAVRYREAQGIKQGAPSLACVVRRMVFTPASFRGDVPVDPRSGERDHMVINLTRGLADELVSGRRNAEQFVLDKTSGDILQGPLKIATGLKPLLGRLAELGLRAEAHFGAPQDLEWAARGTASTCCRHAPSRCCRRLRCGKPTRCLPCSALQSGSASRCRTRSHRLA